MLSIKREQCYQGSYRDIVVHRIDTGNHWLFCFVPTDFLRRLQMAVDLSGS